MSLRSARVLVGIAALAGVACMAADTQAERSESEPWRTSLETFLKAVDVFPMDDMPSTRVDVGELVGQRVDGDAAIMQRFGGRVEFEGVVLGIRTVEDPLRVQPNREKIDIDMPWPSGLSGNTHWQFHLYPKARALKAWKALPPNSAVKFRADVTGIAFYSPWIPGVDRALSIRFEEGEILSR